MQQAIHRLRWQTDHRSLNTNKPLPPLNNVTNHTSSGKRSRTPSKSSKSSSSPRQCYSPIPTISVDASPTIPEEHNTHTPQRNSQLLSPTYTSRRHSLLSPVHHHPPPPSLTPKQIQTKSSPQHRHRIPTQQVIAVMAFLEQQEREMHLEIGRASCRERVCLYV